MNLQSQIDLSIPWFNQLEISMYPAKTTTIIFSNKPLKTLENIKFRDIHIKLSKEMKYWDKKLTFIPYVNNIINKAKFSLYPLLTNSAYCQSKLNFTLLKHT